MQAQDVEVVGESLEEELLGKLLTERTSATSVFLRRRCTGNEFIVASVERMEVAKMTTSGCCSQKSSGSR